MCQFKLSIKNVSFEKAKRKKTNENAANEQNTIYTYIYNLQKI